VSGELIELSDERAQWMNYALDWARDAYAAGYADGQADARREDDATWAAAPVQRVNEGPTFAELELLRWGPGGREHFSDPRPADRFPRKAAAA
jgi:hypothetical protein